MPLDPLVRVVLVGGFAVASVPLEGEPGVVFGGFVAPLLAPC